MSQTTDDEPDETSEETRLAYASVRFVSLLITLISSPYALRSVARHSSSNPHGMNEGRVSDVGMGG